MRRSSLAAIVFLLPALCWAEPSVFEVKRATLETPNAGIVEVVGGFWLSGSTGQERAQELVKLRAENASLRESIEKQDPAGWAVAAGIGLLIGFAGGSVLAAFFWRAGH